MNKYIIEFIGAFFLTLIIAVTGNPIAIGALLTAIIYMGYEISGAHYNPAVTLAVYIIKKISGKDALFYVLAQLVGAAAASLFYHLLYGSTRIFFVFPDHTINILKPFSVEIIFTFILVMVVLFTAANSQNKGNQFYGLAIGLTVLALAYGGHISGSAMNPAVGVMPILFETVWGACSCHPINHVWIYLAGPLIGAAVAACGFRIVNIAEQ